jgi:hypothetical protein
LRQRREILEVSTNLLAAAILMFTISHEALVKAFASILMYNNIDTANDKRQTANRGLRFAAKRANLNLKVSNKSPHHGKPLEIC